MAEQTAPRDNGALHEDIAALREDLERLTRTVGGMAEDRAHSAYDSARSTWHRAQDSSKRMAEFTAHQIEARPFASLMAAFAVGLLLGVVFDRRS